MKLMGLLMLLFYLAGCSAPARDRVIVDELKVMNDGSSIVYKLDSGSYKLELTADGDDGATVHVTGGALAETGPTHQITTFFKLGGTQQLKITNPSAFGLGASVSVTVRVLKLGKESPSA